MKRSQSAIEYMFMMAVALIFVLMVAKLVPMKTKELVGLVDSYVKRVRVEILSDM